MVDPRGMTALTGRRKVAVVTGASAGIGRATAIALARRGFDVALLARGLAGLEGARAEVEKAGGRALVLPLDVADAPAVFAAAERVVAEWGAMDVWVNNAMATVFGPNERVSPEEFRRVTEVTYLGAVHGTLAALRHMRPRGAGTIVQVGSALSYRAIPLQGPYCAAKFALRGFTDSLRCELLHDGCAVRLTMVQLPGVNTPQFEWSRTLMRRRHRPLGAVYQPEAAAEAILRAATGARRELWVGVPAIQSILGAMAAPGLADRYLAGNAYEQQMAREPLTGDRDGILFAPAGRDHGARGRHGRTARDRALAPSGVAVRGCLAGAAMALAAGALLLLRPPPRPPPLRRRPRA